MTDLFDWNSDESVVLPEQHAVAVYSNVRGDVVIRQENPDGADTAICIRPHYVLNICRALLREAGLHGARIVELPFNENELVGRDGNLMHIPREVLEKFDAAGNFVGGSAPRDPTAADSHAVTTEQLQPHLKLAHG